MKSLVLYFGLFWVSTATLAQEVTFSATPVAGCAPLEVNFVNTSTSQSAVNIEWNMGDGSATLTGDTIDYTFREAGEYFVFMTAYDENWNFIDFYQETITVEGLSEYGASKYQTCPGEEIIFFASEGAASYSWDFGDQTVGTGMEATKTYAETGTYSVTITATFNACGEITKSFDVVIGTGSEIDVDFQFDDDEVCPGQAMSFLTVTEGAEYLWDFGDGSNSQQKTPVHKFEMAGTYNVTLTVRDNCGAEGTMTRSVTIGGQTNWPAEMYFLLDKQAVCPGEELTFFVSEGEYTYTYDFGDGNRQEQTDQSEVRNTYSEIGFYNPQVTVYNLCQADTTLELGVEVTNEYSFVDDLFLEAEKDSLCPASENYYIAPAGYENYVWDFGDGSAPVSSLENEISHLYEASGDFTTQVRIFNACGADSLITKDVVVSPGAEEITETIVILGAENACPGSTLELYIRDIYENHIWDFGDGSDTVHTASNSVFYTFEEQGVYNVDLTVFNSCGNSKTVSKEINIDDSNTIPDGLNLTANANVTCPNSTITLSAPSSYQSYVWYLNDQKLDSTSSDYYTTILSSEGTASFSVRIYSACGKTVLLQKDILVSSDLPFSDDIILTGSEGVCPGESVTLFGTGGFKSYVWDFGDGSASMLGSNNMTYTFDQVGEYQVSMTATNGCGQDSTVSTIIVIGNDEPITGIISLGADQEASCPGETVRLSATDGYASYQWVIGSDDPISTTTSQLDYTFMNLGQHSVQLTITNSCGNDTTLTYQHPVDDQGGFPIGIFLSASAREVCPGESISFEAPDGYSDYSWKIGNDSTANEIFSSAVFVFNELGEYTVSVAFQNDCGSKLTLETTVTVNDNARFDSGLAMEVDAAKKCPGDGFVFTAPSGYSNYRWSLQDGQPIDAFQGKTNAEIVFDQEGTYLVYVTFENSCGGSKTLRETVFVDADNSVIKQVSFDFETDFCLGEVVEFFANSGFVSYEWNFGDGVSSSTTLSNTTHVFSQNGTYNVVLTASNSCGLTTTYSEEVTVNDTINQPAFEMLAGDTFCPNEPLSFIAPFGYELYQWHLNDVLLEESDFVINQNLEIGNYEMKLTLTNACGSTASFTKTFAVTPSNDSVDSDIELLQSSSNVCPNDEVTFNIIGENMASYLWFINGSSSTEGTDEFKQSFDTPGTYEIQVQLTNYCGADTTLTTSVEVGGQGAAGETFITVSGIDEEVGYARCAPLTFSVSGGSSFKWDFGDGNQATSTVDSIEHVFETAGTYEVTIDLVNGCGVAQQNTISITIEDQQLPEIKIDENLSPLCVGESNGKLTLSAEGFGPFTLQWNDLVSENELIIPDISAGNYEVTVIDRFGCSASQSIIVSDPDDILLNPTVTNPSCGATDGVIVLALTNPSEYTVLWNDGNQSVERTGLRAGEYSVEVTSNLTGCMKTQTFTLEEEGVTSFTSVVYQISCAGESDGAIQLEIQDDYQSLTWSNGASTETIDNLSAGNYSVEITGNNGCKSFEVFTITEPDTLTAEVTVNNAICGQNAGSASLQINGGTGDYTILWSNGENGVSIDQLVAGFYSVTVTDENGCSEMVSFDLEEEVLLEVSESITNVSCFGAADGSITLTPANGTEPYTFEWSNGMSGAQISALVAGTYEVIITDINDCAIQRTFNISQPEELPAIDLGEDVDLCEDESLTFTVNETFSTLIWSTGDKTNSTSIDKSSFDGVAVYDLVATGYNDNSQCFVSDTVTISLIDCSPLYNQHLVNEISIYPNPVTDILSIKLNEGKISGVQLTLTDMFGKELIIRRSSDISEKGITLDMGAMPEGMYLLKITDELNRIIATKQIIIRH